MVGHALAARRARVALSLVAVSLGVAVATALGTLALQVGDDLARTLRAAGPNFVVLPAGARLPLDVDGVALPARAGLSLPEHTVAALRTSFWKNNVLEAAPELTVPATVNGVRAELSGAWFTRTLATPDGGWTTGLARLHPAWTLEGRWPAEGAGEVALGHALAARLGAHPGDVVTVRPSLPAAPTPAGSATDAGGSEQRWRVTAVVNAGGADDARAWAPLGRAQQLAHRPGEIDRVWLSALVRASPRRPAPDPVRDPHGYERFMCTAYPENVARDLAERLDADVVPATEQLAGEAHVVGRLNLLMLLLALAALTASALGLFSTTTATVVERRVELGLLRSLGAAPRQIAALLLGETLLVSALGGVLGWLLGSLAAVAIRGRTFGAAAPLQPLLLPVAVTLAIAVGLLGTLAPLRAALRIDPARALRG
jgi:putative ABC transport system permease protein